ncbi:MAG: hypothetical protein OIF55_03650, partial [Amphritea sp.]|nr:hypothetical protein [Amphritea sp.]
LRIEKEFDSDGRKTMQRTRDGDDNFDWTYKLRQFQNSELTYSRTVYDDSTREELHFDSDGNVTFSEVQDERAETSWSSITKGYDSMGQLAREAIDYDNGDTVEKSFSNGVLSRVHFTDGDQSETWKTRSISYDSATGEITSKTVENHNGYYVSTIISGSHSSIYERDGSLADGDNGNEPWRTKSTQFGPSGTLLSRTTTYDNGDETHYSYDYIYGTLQSIRLVDGDGSESWTEFQRTYDPSGALTSKSVVGSNGIRTTTSTNTYNGNVTITETDVVGAPGNTGIMPWQSKSITRTSDGTLHSKSTTFDNGDSVYRSYFSDGSVSSIRRTDGDNSESWKALEFNFNTDGSIQSRRIVEANDDSEHLYYNSDGSLSSRTLTDGDDSDSWTSLSYYYSATGDLDSVQINGENGAYEQKYFNANGDLIRFVQNDAYFDGSHNWQQITTNYDPDGTILTKLITFDNYGASASTVYNADGSRVVTAQDGSAHNSQHAWHTKVSTYAADGSLASVHRTMDSGEQTETGFDAAGNIISTTVFDHADAFVWSSKAKSFDAAGAQIGDTVTYDDGRISETTYVNGIRT